MHYSYHAIICTTSQKYLPKKGAISQRKVIAKWAYRESLYFNKELRMAAPYDDNPYLLILPYKGTSRSLLSYSSH